MRKGYARNGLHAHTHSRVFGLSSALRRAQGMVVHDRVRHEEPSERKGSVPHDVVRAMRKMYSELWTVDQLHQLFAVQLPDLKRSTVKGIIDGVTYARVI